MDDQAPRKRLRDLLHDDVATQIGVGVTHHGAQTAQRIPRVVGMHGGHRAGVIGLHRLQHLVSLRPATFANDDAIGAPAQRERHQLAHADCPFAFGVRLARLHPLDVRGAQPQLRRILDGQDSLVIGNEPGKRAEHGRLSRAGASGYDHGAPSAHRRAQKLRHHGAEGASRRQILDAHDVIAEQAKVERGTVRGKRRHDVSRSRLAARQHGAAHGMRLVAAHARLLGDLVDDATEMVGIVEPNVRARLQSPCALHEHMRLQKPCNPGIHHHAAAVDDDLGDPRVLQQPLQRAVAKEIVSDRTAQASEVGPCKAQVPRPHGLLHKRLDGRFHLRGIGIALQPCRKAFANRPLQGKLGPSIHHARPYLPTTCRPQRAER